MVKRKANKGKKYYSKSVPAVEANDISDRFDENDINDEIDDFHDNEDKILLSKSYVSERKTQKDQLINVYDVEDTSDDDDEYDEKINDYQNKLKGIKSKKESDDLFDDYEKNLKSWGKKTSNFYGGENEMQIDSDVDENDKDAAQLEEEESMFLQKQQQQHLDDQDFELDDIFKKSSSSSGVVDTMVQLTDLNNLSKSEKIMLVKRNSPELKGIFRELKKKLKYISNSLVPLIDIYPGLKHLKNKLRLYLNYCVNLLFYLVLKSNQEDVQNHPILISIKEYYMAIQNLNDIENKYDPESYIDILKNYQENLNADPNLIKKIKKKSLSQNAIDDNSIESDDTKDENNISLEDGTDRRAIDYTISKNKGLTPRRKKENRNPRVKHRNKYRKALIRRKGQVRPVRKELNKYDGEISGIKMGIIRSRK